MGLLRRVHVFIETKARFVYANGHINSTSLAGVFNRKGSLSPGILKAGPANACAARPTRRNSTRSRRRRSRS